MKLKCVSLEELLGFYFVSYIPINLVNYTKIASEIC